MSSATASACYPLGMGGALKLAADAVFETYSPYPGIGFRNHNLRLYELTKLVMRADGIEFDDDTAYAIAMAHDLGLVSERDDGVDYLHRSLSLFRREFAHAGYLVDETVLEECLLLNHRVSPVPNASAPAEAFRKAVWVEHTRGLRRYGRLDRAEVRAVFRRHPRGNLDAVLFDFARRTLRHEPRSIVDGIFF